MLPVDTCTYEVPWQSLDSLLNGAKVGILLLLCFTFVLMVLCFYSFFFLQCFLIHASHKFSESGVVVSYISPYMGTVLLVFRDNVVCFSAAIQTGLILNN